MHRKKLEDNLGFWTELDNICALSFRPQYLNTDDLMLGLLENFSK